jgi:hypothetical protein
MHWQYDLISGEGNNPLPILGAEAGRKILIVCPGHTLWDDLTELGHIISGNWEYDFMGVNYAGMLYPAEFRHWVSIHPEIFQWMQFLIYSGYKKKKAGQSYIYQSKFEGICHSHNPMEGFEGIAWQTQGLSGTSSLFAASVAYCLGYDKIIIAGAPLDNKGHFYDPPWNMHEPDKFEDKAILNNWTSYSKKFGDKVRGLTGGPRKGVERILGPPTLDWINGN